jgi:hypothetical protein
MSTSARYVIDGFREFQQLADKNFKKAYANYVTKLASIGGDQEGTFEQTLASLAFMHIQDKAPKLLDYLLGFQLIDRNEDNTKAVGAFGFQIDKQMVLVPIFFLSGDMKGHEMMFLVNQEMFAPLKENWVNYILKKKPQILGEGSPQNLQQLGIYPPNIAQLVLPPFTASKYSFEKRRKSASGWAAMAINALGNVAMDHSIAADVEGYFFNTGKAAHSGLLDKALDKDPRLVKAAQKVCEAWPGVKENLDKHYGSGYLETKLASAMAHLTKLAELNAKAQTSSILCKTQKAAKKSNIQLGGSVLKSSAADSAPDLKPDKVYAITEDSVTLTHGERAAKEQNGLLIRDYREGDEFTVKYDISQQIGLMNPTQTGVYDVLLNDGKYAKCLLIFAPYGIRGQSYAVTLVKLEKDGDSRACVNVPARKLFIRSGNQEEEPDKGWFDLLPDDAKPANGVKLVAITRNGGSLPLSLERNLTDNTYACCCESHVPSRYEDKDHDGVSLSYSELKPCGYGDSPSAVFGVRKGSTFLLGKGGVLYIPEGAKLIKLKEDKCKKCGKTKDNCTCEYFGYDYGNTVEIFPGGPEDLTLSLTAKTAELKVAADSCDITINGKTLSRRDALADLVLTHGLSQKDAEILLKEAGHKSVARWRVKYAAGFPRKQANMGAASGFPPPSEGGSMYNMSSLINMPLPAGSPMPYTTAPITSPIEQQQTVPGMESGLTDPYAYDPMVMEDPMLSRGFNTAQSNPAGQDNSKEVFDTSMLSTLTKMVNPDVAADEDLNTYAQAMNKLGRRLFMYFWHNEAFQERYGKKDLPELEDTLRNVFESMGDLLLYLKQKSGNTMFGTSVQNIGPSIENASRI